MSDDKKTDFYLANRALIEEWASLRVPAANALDRALLDAARRLSEEEGLAPEIIEDRGRTVRLHVTEDPLPRAWLELWWEKSKLLKEPGGWPTLTIVMNPKSPRQVRDAVKNATALARDAHGMTATSSQWWLRYGEVPPQQEPLDIEDYGQYCIRRLRESWRDLRAPISAAVQASTGS